MGRSEATTRGIRVRVESRFVPERSQPSGRKWFFAYTIEIANLGDKPAQLLNRHWVITDGNGHEEQVRGPGVVGQQPRLAPGERFRYTSFCPLGTAFGTMHGTYEMERDGGERFDAEIAPFSLSEPYAVN